MAGVDVALETADVVLLTDNLHQWPFLIRLARKADRILSRHLHFSSHHGVSGGVGIRGLVRASAAHIAHAAGCDGP